MPGLFYAFRFSEGLSPTRYMVGSLIPVHYISCLLLDNDSQRLTCISFYKSKEILQRLYTINTVNKQYLWLNTKQILPGYLLHFISVMEH